MTVNVVPRPSSLSNVIVPPYNSTDRLTITDPRPVPQFPWQFSAMRVAEPATWLVSDETLLQTAATSNGAGLNMRVPDSTCPMVRMSLSMSSMTWIWVWT